MRFCPIGDSNLSTKIAIFGCTKNRDSQAASKFTKPSIDFPQTAAMSGAARKTL
jgi:hypothetical protein